MPQTDIFVHELIDKFQHGELLLPECSLATYGLPLVCGTCWNNEARGVKPSFPGLSGEAFHRKYGRQT